MKQSLRRIGFFLLLVWLSLTFSMIPSSPAEEQTLYTCGMHPNVVQDHPGTCPICGMDLTPMQKKSDASPSEGNVVTIDPSVVQNMGVRVAHVERGSISRAVRTIGEVDVAEDEISVVNLRFSGWIEEIWANQTGQMVKAGDWLFSMYSPELVSAQKEYLLTYNTNGPNSDLTRSAAERLRLWDIPESYLKKIVREQNVGRTYIVKASRSGYVLQKNAILGVHVKAGQDLYRIGNLKRIWVTAEVYEFDAPWIDVGQPASMELSFQQGRFYEGKVGYIYPTLNPKSRTLKVRMEFENPGVILKPGMFATVRIQAERKENVLTIPSEAILQTGERNIVFVSETEGRYEAREVVTGLTGDDHRTEVLEGLQEGELVVTSGQFLLDSEAQLQEAVQKLINDRLQATSEANTSQKNTHDHANMEHNGEYYTCPMHPTIVQETPGDCPICGMDLVKKQRAAP